MKTLRKTIQPIRTPWMNIALLPISQFTLVIASDKIYLKILWAITGILSTWSAYQLWPATPKPVSNEYAQWLDELDAPIYAQLHRELEGDK